MTNPPVGEFPVVPTFNEPEIPDHRAEPMTCRQKYLPGDWSGLTGLAGELYGYVRQQESAGTIGELVGWVKALVQSDPDLGGYDGKWAGLAAHYFTQTFTVDAALMNGLNKVVCRVASVIDDLGYTLAMNEYYLESSLEGWGRRYDPRFTLEWLTYAPSASYPLHWNPPSVANAANWDPVSLSLAASNLRKQFMDKADDDRRRAGTELTGIANLLFEAASFYVNQAYHNSKAPETLLNPVQAQDLKQNFDAVQKNLKKYSEQLNADSGDVNAAAQELTALGSDSKEVTALLGDVKNVKKAEGFVAAASAIGTLAGDAFPELAAIGLAL
jgi:hypothetical protein